MPRDEWRKATLRAKYGPVGYETGRKQKRKHKNRSRTQQRAARNSQGKITKHGWNPNSKLWFGIHKDKAIKDIPESYLRWLAGAMKATGSWRVNALVAYLTEYLQP